MCSYIPENKSPQVWDFVTVEIKKPDFCLVENIISQVTTGMWCANTASLMSYNGWKDILEGKIMVIW